VTVVSGDGTQEETEGMTGRVEQDAHVFLRLVLG
jgi:hypothetical protein